MMTSRDICVFRICSDIDHETRRDAPLTSVHLVVLNCANLATFRPRLSHVACRVLNLVLKLVLQLSISVEVSHARAKYIFCRFYTAPYGAPLAQQSGGPQNFDTLVIRGLCSTFLCVCMFLQNSRSTKGAGSIFGLLSTFMA